MARTRDPLVERPVDLDPARCRARRVSRIAVAAALLMALVAGTGTNGGVAGAEAPAPAESDAADSAETLGVTYGWYWNAGGGLSVNWECVETRYGPMVRARVDTKMWSKGGRVKAFKFKVRLVPADSAGQLQWSRAWSNYAVHRFTPTSARREQWMRGWTPSENGAASWEVEVKMEWPRSLRLAYSKKFRIGGTVSPDCSGGPILVG